MKNELMRASDLGLPHISGTVQVPLAELDKMRTDHANAVKLAKELEARQGEVKIILTEERMEMEYSHRDGHSRSVKRMVQSGIEYKNFEEFRAPIALEERNRVQKELETQQKQITKKQEEIAKMYKTHAEYKERTDKEISELKEVAVKAMKIPLLENEIDSLKSQLEVSNQQRLELQRELHKSKKDKSFWYWLTK